MIIVGTLLFVKKKAGLTERFALETKDGVPSWSLALSASGGTLGILAGMSMGISLLCKTKDYEEEDHSGKAYDYWQQKYKDVN